YRRMAERASSEAAITTLGAVAAWQVTERLGEIGAPTLVIGGDRDRSTEPAEQLRLYRGLQRGRLCILPNCAHAAHLEEPELFIRLIKEFLGAG
ncbi:MAG TPA: alpha/beta hydrolase, partial [Burkholderiales bacterium]|nr:alpha/beta hydrolase [Burkholderiales bacterium]